MISLYTTSSELPPPETSYDAVRESVHFVDCDNIKATIYFFSAYLDLGKIPFVDTPDFSYLPPGETIIETYRHVPTQCNRQFVCRFKNCNVFSLNSATFS